MSADPPWLDEAERRFFASLTACDGGNIRAALAAALAMPQANDDNGWIGVVRAVLVFAARQPVPITDAMIEAAQHHVHLPPSQIRAALEAALKARANG